MSSWQDPQELTLSNIETVSGYAQKELFLKK